MNLNNKYTQASSIGETANEIRRIDFFKEGYECNIENNRCYTFFYCIIKETNVTIDDEAAQTYFDLVGRGQHSDLQPLYLNPDYKRSEPQGFRFK